MTENRSVEAAPAAFKTATVRCPNCGTDEALPSFAPSHDVHACPVCKSRFQWAWENDTQGIHTTLHCRLNEVTP